MKTIQDIFDWDFMTAPQTLVALSYKCQRGVAWKGSVLRFIHHRYRSCIKLSYLLRTGQYKKKPLFHFTLNERGKTRLISPVNYVDRLVQKTFCEHCLLPLIVPTLINDNGASLKNKGTQFSRDRFKHHLQSFIRKYGTDGYFVSVDYHNYFHSINNDIAFNNFYKWMHAKARNQTEHDNVNKILNVLKQFIYDEQGMGLGNQTSQLVAISYCNHIDHYIKEKLRIKQYGRYMDDSYAFVHTKAEAHQLVKYITEASEQIGLKVNTNKTCIMPITRPFTWLKNVYYVSKTGKINIKVKSCVYRRFKRHINNIIKAGKYDAVMLSIVSFGGIINRATNKNAFKYKVEKELPCQISL